jgi:hypothetical protein
VRGIELLTGAMRTRNVVLSVIGAAALVLKSSYAGPFHEIVHAYGGNFAVSFALYFAAVSATQRYRYSCLGAALIVLLAVTAFEVSDGFGFMANVYDPVDLLANAAGVGFAIVVDLLSARLMSGEALPGSAAT